MRATSLRTVKQIVSEYPWVTEPMVRWWIFKRDENGFAYLLSRVGGRRWQIDKDRFEAWVDAQRLVAGEAAASVA